MKRRLFITYAALLLVGFFIVGYFTNSFVRINYIENLESKLTSNLRLIRLEVLDSAGGRTLEELDLDGQAERFARELDMRVTFIDSEGRVLGDSEVPRADLPEVENHRDRPEFKAALSGEVGTGSRLSATVNVNYLYMAIPLEQGGAVVGAVRLAYPMVEIARINRVFIENILLSMAIALAIALYMASRYTRSITRPILSITDSAKRIARGDFDRKVKVETGDEIEVLGEAFNTMSGKLKENIEELRDKNLKLQSILTSMSEGLMAVDNENRVLLMNYPGKDYLAIRRTDIFGEILTDLIEEPAIREAVADLLSQRAGGKCEIVLHEPVKTVLKINVSQIRSDVRKREVLGAIMIIQDVTEIRNLEEMRTEFVANVSHELKTPLTSIAGFVETLKNGAIENEAVRDRFLDIIEIESGRLSRLIDDLLILSNIEKNSIGWDRREAVDVHAVIREVLDMVALSAEGKAITLKEETPEDLPELKGNRDWFKQMVLNLVDNAVKYTPEGGAVHVATYRFDQELLIKVADTGIGIPQGDIPRLFERFYRVDKARSREVGGTGLGLAIVKHIVLAFGGEIKVRSVEGEGTEFIVKIPLTRP